VKRRINFGDKYLRYADSFTLFVASITCIVLGLLVPQTCYCLSHLSSDVPEVVPVPAGGGGDNYVMYYIVPLNQYI
jgi:hypothetical protein